MPRTVASTFREAKTIRLIAMGAAETDTAIETADIALMKDDLNKVAEAVHLGRHTLRIIQTNIIFALAVKALFLVLALFGGKTPLIA
jgi:Cd2+/Zn2+-exporting ATPase